MLALLRKHPLIILSALLITVLLVWGFWPQPVLVEAVTVNQAPLTVTIEEEGRTRLMDRYVISAPVAGVTCRLQLKVGDPVKQGQMLLGITPLQSQVLDDRSRAQARAKVAAAESALRAAREQARAAVSAQQLADTDLQRLRPLAEKSLASKDSLDKAIAQADSAAANKRSADFQVEVAQYELEAARSVLQYDSNAGAEPVPVRSPIDGKILKVQHECSGPVQTGEPLLEVGDPSALEVEVDLLSADAVKIKPGMKVLFDRWGGDHSLEGRVRNIEPVGFTKVSALGVEEQRVLVISDFTSPPEEWQRLGDGYRVEARFVLWHGDQVLQVPVSSLFRYHDGWAVFVYRDGRARRQPVKLGERNGIHAQILEGLQAGQQVIVHPGDDVDDGRSVKLQQLQ